MSESNFKARRLFQAARVKAELEEYLDAWLDDVKDQVCAEHLSRVGTICRLLYEKLVRVTGATLETNSYARQISDLAELSLRLQPEGPGIVKAKARLSVIPGGLTGG